MNLLDKKEPYYIKIYQIIKDRIFDGTYQPGEKIVESQLNKEFGVSKSPVREAIRVLENEGLIVVKGSRLYIYETSAKDIQEVYTFRAVIESYATKQFTIYATNKDVQKLENTLKNAKKMITNNKKKSEIMKENAKFHQIILNKSENDILIRHYNIINSLVNYYRNINIKGKGRCQEILNQHQEIFNLIKANDINGSAIQMVKHLEQDVLHLFEVLDIDQTINLDI